jgi:hypothetical protein
MLSPWLIAFTGHSDAHAPQLMQVSLITYAIICTPPYIIGQVSDLYSTMFIKIFKDVYSNFYKILYPKSSMQFIISSIFKK